MMLESEMQRFCYEAKYCAVDTDTTEYGGGSGHQTMLQPQPDTQTSATDFLVDKLCDSTKNDPENFEPQLDRKT